jgi:hypothetical protein
MKITFESLEQVKSKIAEHEALCKDFNQQRAAAQKEVDDAKAKATQLTDRQIEGENVIDELGRALGFVAVAEEKQKRLLNTVGVTNPQLELKGLGTINNLKNEIRRTFQETMKEETEALEIAKKQYLAAAEKALLKYYGFYYASRDAQEEWLYITKERVPFNLEAISLSDLRPSLWVDGNDYSNEFCLVREKASK